MNSIITDRDYLQCQIDQAYQQEFLTGLQAFPKHINSKFLYDAAGNEWYAKIMELEEYYPAQAELEIFQTAASWMNKLGSVTEQVFDLIELGSGDGQKTAHLIEALLAAGHDFRYKALDFSKESLRELASRFRERFPGLNIQTRQEDFMQEKLDFLRGKHPKLILFLGSSLGNLKDDEAQDLLLRISKQMQKGDKILLGLDLIKDYSIVHPAYADSQNITAEFNYNLLRRANRSLGANFDLEKFSHYVAYDEEEGIVRTSLISLTEQSVYFPNAGIEIQFEQGEPTSTEISRKYNDRILASLLQASQLKIEAKIMDSKKYFAEYLLIKA